VVVYFGHFVRADIDSFSTKGISNDFFSTQLCHNYISAKANNGNSETHAMLPTT